MDRFFKILLISFMVISFAFAEKQIDTFNILLPQINKQNNGKPIELITTQGGCFQWSSSYPQAVSAKGIPSDNVNCFVKGLIQLNQVGSYSSSIYITATNSQTQQISNIPVRIRPIQKIQIIAKSRMMNKNQMQDLHVFAYDKQHNMFTSLQGLKFEWRLIQNKDIISKISLKNSQLILPLDQRKIIEQKGFESDILVIRGQNPGKAIISVHCIEPGYQNLRHQITVSVHQRFDISPSIPTYLLVDSSYKFNLVTPSKKLIQIPKTYYKTTLSSSNFNISNVLQIITPNKQDQTTIKVEDARTSPPYFSQVQVFSKQPDQIVLKVNQYLVVGEQSNVQVQLYWKKHLLQGKNNKYYISTNLPYDLVKKTIKGNQRSVTTIKATYGNLSCQRKVTIVHPLKAVLPSNKIILPPNQIFELKIVGGSGVYEYQIDGDISAINSNGIITSKKEGQTLITVFDKKIPKNKITINLVVSPIHSLTPLQINKQLNINQFGQIFTIGKTVNQQQYTKCEEQKISLDIEHLSSFELISNISLSSSLNFLKSKMYQSQFMKQSLMKKAIFKYGVDKFVQSFAKYYKSGDVLEQQILRYANQIQNFGICSAHSLKSYQKYDSKLDVFANLNNVVKSSFHLRVYDKITNNLTNSTSDYFIITPLASLQWKTLGGSYQWNKKTLVYINQQLINTTYPILRCPIRQLNLQITLMKRNQESQQLLLPVHQQKKIYVQCKYPISLKIDYQLQNFESFVVNGIKGQLIKGKIIPLDNKGQFFYNSSNLIYQSNTTAGFVRLVDNFFQFDPKNQLNAKITFWTQKIEPGNLHFPQVQTSFSYFGHQMFSINPYVANNHLVILYNPRTSYYFNITKLSENYENLCQGSIYCAYSNINSQLKVNTTGLGKGIMILKDKSLYGYPFMKITFEVVQADEIFLQTSKNSVQIYKNIEAQIKVYYKKSLIPTWQYDSNNFILVHEAGIRSKLISNQYNVGKNAYEILTEKPGIYHLIAEQKFQKPLQSPSVLLTVYPKIKTNIQNIQESYDNQNILQLKGEITVAINCLRKISIYGGPQQIKVTHRSNDKDSLQINYKTKNFRQFQIFGVENSITKMFFQISSLNQKDSKVATLELLINIKPISRVYINSLDELVLNSQFRLIPYLILDQKILLDNYCQFIYQWRTEQNIKIKTSDPIQPSINATAVKQGNTTIFVQVFSKHKQLLFSTQKTIQIHKSLDIQVPTIIGQHQNAISPNLLIPPNSGYSFEDSNIYITKISQCQDTLLSISQNKLLTSRQKGIANIKLQKSNDKNYNNLLNIVVTDIKALFIQNNLNKVNLQSGKNQKVKFYVQDMYGRLFYNNLINIDYDAISTNQDIFTVSIDSTKSYINLYPKKQGQARLILKLKTSDTSINLSNLLKMPHDIVTVSVGKVLQPQSPIYTVIGGEIKLQYPGKESDKWQIINGNENVQIIQKDKIIRGKQLGQATIMIGGYTAIVRVLDPQLRQKVVQVPRKGFNKAVIQYVALGKWNNDIIYLESLQHQVNHINNEMKLSCITNSQAFYKTSSSIVKENNYQKLVCQVTKNHKFDLTQKIPSTLQMRVMYVDKTGRAKSMYDYKVDIGPTFWIPQKYKQILISPQNPDKRIIVKSSQVLRSEVVKGQQSWIKQTHSVENQEHIIQLNVDSKAYSKNTQFGLKIKNSNTGQEDQIQVFFVIDDQTRKKYSQDDEEMKSKPEKKKEKQNKGEQKRSEEGKKEQKKEQKQKAEQSIFSGWQWTDFLIVIMAIQFIIIVVYQACVNGQNKYKNL